ncbi:hypothetical protein C8R42DRAFT_667799 [Lentinula raphanica]|nr:hypothetical protein C8R42DRAFT_667799 [Lentinula raphanica]
MMTPDIDEIPLPHGWVEEFHESGHPYYVDTLANPPRSIWIHPYEDEQYLRQHPEDEGKLEAWVAAQRSRSPSPAPDSRSASYATTDVKVPIAAEGSAQEYYSTSTRHAVDHSEAAMMNGPRTLGDRGLPRERGMPGGVGVGERGLVGGLLGSLAGRAEMADERRDGYYDPRFGMGGGPGMPMMDPGMRGLGIVDRRLERAMRHQEKLEYRMQRRQEKFDRRMDRRFGGRYTPPALARPVYYPGQYSMQGYGPQQYGGGQYYAPPPPTAMPHKEEHHGGKVLPFLGGVAVGVAGDELFHHFKDKKEDKD